MSNSRFSISFRFVSFQFPFQSITYGFHCFRWYTFVIYSFRLFREACARKKNRSTLIRLSTIYNTHYDGDESICLRGESIFTWTCLKIRDSIKFSWWLTYHMTNLSKDPSKQTNTQFFLYILCTHYTLTNCCSDRMLKNECATTKTTHTYSDDTHRHSHEKTLTLPHAYNRTTSEDVSDIQRSELNIQDVNKFVLVWQRKHQDYCRRSHSTRPHNPIYALNIFSSIFFRQFGAVGRTFSKRRLTFTFTYTERARLCLHEFCDRT